MGKSLVIVESPAKAKTIKKYLGGDYEVLASYGHIRDLLPKEGAVDPANNFAMKYELIERNSRHVDAIVKQLRGADQLLLATDPDREGEAISWHLLQYLQSRRGLMKDKPVGRIQFNEITKRAIQEAVEHPRPIAMALVNAQQARRALDYLVGFNLSPLLWRKIRGGLSAGRVQSPALRLIVEREEEIERFIPQEYWTIEALVAQQGQPEPEPFKARLIQLEGNKLDQFDLNRAETAHSAEAKIAAAANGRLQVAKVEKKQRKRNPAPPFTTSTLQQEASRKLGFGAQRTMRIAQQLYEGIDIGGETVGLITYMRTDSVNLASEAIEELRQFIVSRYGTATLPPQPRLFKTKSKNAQEAHEAVRPTSAMRTPQQLASHLTKEQLRLYELIWKRTVACQMKSATLNTVAIDLIAQQIATFRANGSVVVDPGFMTVYQEGRDDSKNDEGENRILPPLQEGEWVDLVKLLTEQHFTEPPPRFSEATLVKTLEEYGIGRPSTYASIISTLQQRDYVEMDKKRFIPTDVGRTVNRFLTEHFTRYVDYEFTARLEDELDAISRGEEEWIPLLHRFWQPFHTLVEDKDQSVSRKDVTEERLEESCPECGQYLVKKLGKRGRFIGCSGYPDCSYTRNLDGESSQERAEPELVEGRNCPKCNSPLVYRIGRYGKFIGCSGYPQCRHIESLEQPQDTGVECPKCHKGTLQQRKSRRGKLFYSCATYPACDYATWDLPLAEPCPECGWPILTLKVTKRRGEERVCPQKECGYRVAVAGSGETTASAEQEQ
ncbi:type I DNA topoisomerase [Ectothiorhodospiraceae bacterium BW-2]|nr:type I DNA topoisomerase [Ectothiorhodospiraceae bacterium BW-2]